ncbi:hypothetical protein KO516_03320 [Citreicella sp. C3M06]|uniref:hypothetical protein n=1 Tax=Citreicella sp. C3M06 TaxID=2841564 RepID=UPI001C08B65E|nr:hypothetical protein [Citreicella sp. C3M06]MBU2959870.1 hypothetical protein [Citreicella sp. C3M06]
MIEPTLTPELARLDRAAPVEFQWDEWKFQSYFYFGFDEELARFRTLTPNACRALTLALCEWVEHRFSAANDDPMPRDYIAAGWAALVNRSWSRHIGLDDRHWSGPVLGPLMAGFGIVNEMFYESGDAPDMAFPACYALNLSRHVLPAGGEFDSWLETVQARLLTHHLAARDPLMEGDIFDIDFPQGALVPRSAFDTSRPYTPDASAARAELIALARAEEALGNEYVAL